MRQTALERVQIFKIFQGGCPRIPLHLQAFRPIISHRHATFRAQIRSFEPEAYNIVSSG